MGLGDCVNCWDTPCQCGYEYRDCPVDALQHKIAILEYVIQYQKAHPLHEKYDKDQSQRCFNKFMNERRKNE